MALVIYPTADYDSFVSVADATTVIGNLTLYSEQWTALTSTEQEVYLRIACRFIEDGIDTDTYPYPDPMVDCIAESQSLIAIQDVVYGFSASVSNDESGAIKKQKVSSIEIEYYDIASKTSKFAPRVPEMAMPCLDALGFVAPTNISGLSQLTLGRS